MMNDNYLAKLEECIKDDDKIVTVASYAISADIPFEESKKIINKYVEINQNSTEIHVTYVLNGIKRDTGMFSVMQVSDEALESEKQQYKFDPAAMIFSVQKAKQIDYNVISLVESTLDFKTSNLSGAIVGKNCIKRLLRKNNLPPLPITSTKGKSTVLFKQNVKSEVKSEEANKADEKNESNHGNQKTKVAPQGSIANMFKAAQTKKPESKRDKSAEKQKQNGALTNYFTKQPKADLPKALENQIKKEKEVDPNIKENVDKYSLTNKTNSEKNANEKNKNQKSDLFDSDTDEEILNDINMQEISATELLDDKRTEAKSSQKKIRTSKKKKREKADVGNTKSVKKRKRIIVDEDSDSDDIFGSERSNDEETITEKYNEESELAKIESIPLPPKNKRRKAVKKTYEDEEGFIVTQTEFVYETASEDENEPNNKMVMKEEPPKPKKKSSNSSEPEISPNKSTKTNKGSKKVPSSNQPTLMNFFKKK